jgi:16S rRNA (cytosine967-C5)-methyltransferase
MKLHAPLLKAVAEALTDIFEQDKQADKVIERLLKSNPKLGSRDRAFIAETVYDLVRWWRLYTHLAGNDTAIHRLVGIHLVLKYEQNFAEFPQLDFTDLEKRKNLIRERKIRYALPDWLDNLGEQELGDENWTQEIAALNRTAALVIRCNTLKINVSELKEKLALSDWASETTPLSKTALVLKKRGNIFQTDLFRQGLFEVQDAGSQTIAPFLQVEAGMRVVDACAGAGGKTLHLANLMENKGKIIALDTEGWKLEELRRRARRNGVHIAETRLIDSTKTIKRLQGSADRLLLDVPCSGLGVLRRNPDSKWKLQAAFLQKIQETQSHILASYAKILRGGGRLVYATCSILPSENEAQVKTFLAKNPDFKWLDERKISPARDGFDGFYMALLEKK